MCNPVMTVKECYRGMNSAPKLASGSSPSSATSLFRDLEQNILQLFSWDLSLTFTD